MVEKKQNGSELSDYLNKVREGLESGQPIILEGDCLAQMVMERRVNAPLTDERAVELALIAWDVRLGCSG